MTTLRNDEVNQHVSVIHFSVLLSCLFVPFVVVVLEPMTTEQTENTEEQINVPVVDGRKRAPPETDGQGQKN